MRETVVEHGAVREIPCGWPSISVFYGIPCAKPPVGVLRWWPPQPAENWDGVRDCSRPRARCPQARPYAAEEFYPYDEPMSEDCLYLNVWTPAQSTQERFPVLFWIHGGAFTTGYGHAAHFDGEHFARQGVIPVTINCRLNIFGWMVHPELSAENDLGISGNYGLMDQLCALEWVKGNIAAFGGDPEHITIAGQSAGAISVNCMLHSPLLPKGITGAIMESGGGLMGFSDINRTVKEAEDRADLSELGAKSIAEARGLVRRWLRYDMDGTRLQICPVIDGCVLPRPIDQVTLEGNSAPVPTLVGYTAEENVPAIRTPEAFRSTMGRDMGEEAAEEFFRLCPLTEEAGWNRFMFSCCTELLRSSCEAWGKLCQKKGKPPVYVCILTRNPPGDNTGASHSSDLVYIFHTFSPFWRPWTGQDYEISVPMNTCWASFARYGTPNGANGINDRVLPTWVPYTVETELTMDFGEEIIGMRHLPDNPRVSFRREAMLKRAGDPGDASTT